MPEIMYQYDCFRTVPCKILQRYADGEFFMIEYNYPLDKKDIVQHLATRGSLIFPKFNELVGF